MAFKLPFSKKKAQVKPRTAVRKSAGKGSAPSSPGLRRHIWITVLMGALIWTVASLTSLHQRELSTTNLVVGQAIQADLYSAVPFSHVDKNATAHLREKARQAVPPVFVVDRRQTEEAMKTLGLVIQRGLQEDAVTSGRGTPFDESIVQILKQMEELKVLDILPDVLGKISEERLKETFLRQLQHGIVTDNPEDTFFDHLNADDVIVVVDDQKRRMSRTIKNQLNRQQAAEEIGGIFAREAEKISGREKRTLEVLARLIIRPNLIFDAEATTKDRSEAAAAVPEQTVVIGADKLLLERGEKITPEMLRLLNEHRMELEQTQQGRQGWREAIFHTGMSLCLLLAFGYMLTIVHPPALQKTSKLVLVAILVVLQLLLTRVYTDLFYARTSLSSIHYMSTVPLAIGAMLMVQLLGLRVTMVAVVYTSLLATFQSPQSLQLQLFLTSLFSSLVGALLFDRARKRIHSLQTAVGIALTIVFVQLLFLIKHEVPLGNLDRMAMLALLNGFVVTVVAFSLLPLFEVLFGVTTDISLIELSDLNHPLLQRMQMEAPGTYHHSLMVATLAEHAAAAIGANPLLARVVAYFHDIGKMSQPEYFTENMSFSSHTPHDSLQPRMSSLVILNHVREGLALAERYKLRKVIREGISQHHGTSLISYFYHRAKDQQAEANDGSLPEARDYRYPGPTPIRKEVVLLCIADTCEAASRSLEKPTPQKIENLVDELVGKKIRDGQFDSADLTFRELAIAKQSIISTLVNMFHGRIAYPKDEKDTDEGSSEKTDTFPAAEKPETADSGGQSGADGNRA